MPKDLEKEDLAELPGQYAIRPQTPKEEARNEATQDDIPNYKIRIDLNADQQGRLESQFKEEFDALVAERASLGLPSKWESLDRQYDGELRKNSKLTFNLHTHQSKIKTDAIVRALNEAFLDSDPMVDVSPRPEQWREQDKDGKDICEAQQQFLQYEVQENIQPQADLTRIALCAVKKFVGIGKLEWCYEKEKRRREEVYSGENEIVYGPNGQPQGVQNKALKEFVGNYPDAQQRYPNIFKKISEGKTVRLVVEYLDTVQNSAKLRHVSVEDFYVKNSTFYYDGLKKAHLVVERQTKTWWELQKKVANEEFDAQAVENLEATYTGHAPAQSTTKQTARTRDYSILEATTYLLMDEDDEEETKIKAWFAETGEKETKYVFLGAILYPYYGFDVDYIPFYVKLNNDGFYGAAKSVMGDLRDSNIAQDVLLNLALHSIYIRNVLTPIVAEGSEISAAFIENRWQDGKPIEVDAMTEDVSKAIDFVEYPQINLQDFVVLDAQLKRQDGDVTGVSSLMTGRESPSDPHSPAAKTIALLNQSGISVKDYIRTFLPGFNTFVSNLLQIYYQMSQEGRPFQIGQRSKAVTGNNEIFNTITRDQMAARTNIQARASAFAFDKAMEKQENLAAFQLFASTPEAATQPEAHYKALKTVLKSWSPTWNNFAENDLMSTDDFNKKQMAVAMQAVATILANQQQQAKVTGIPAELPKPEQLGAAVTQAQVAAANPKIAQGLQKEVEKNK